MKQQGFEKLLQQQAPAPDPAARLRARRAALEAFKVVPAVESAPEPKSRLQGLLAALRLSRTHSDGRGSMPWYSNKWLGGAATACVATVAVVIGWPLIEAQKVTAPPSEAPPQRIDAEMPAEVAQPEAPQADAPMLKDDRAAKLEASPAVVTSRLESAKARQEKNKPTAAGPAAGGDAVEEIVVGGYRRTQQSALEIKRSAVEYVEVTSAEPIANLPDAKVAEALQRIPGVTTSEQAKQEAHDGVEEVIITGARRDNVRAFSPKGPPAAPRASVAGQLGAIAPAPPPPAAVYEGRDKFEHFDPNSVKLVAEEPVSTFSADVDTASYSFVRRNLMSGVLPQKDAVRVEEMINYFDYAWPLPASREQPFQPTIVVSESPWGAGKQLVHIGIKGYDLPAKDKPDANLVLLLDVSGSMGSPDKLPLAVSSMELLLSSLKPTDTVGIVVYAGAAGLVLEPTPVSEKEKIVAALRSLTPGGSTAGAQGIELAYQLAEKHLRKGGVNRILLATDGDFNVGITDRNELKGFVERKRANGVGLSVLGYGMGNYQDELAQALAQNGNGVAAYIDSIEEARKVLVSQASAALFTIAKDVKLQVEFNPATVHEYRLVGYETRALKREDFNNDAVDAGDIGAGHTVTAIYEITPVGSAAKLNDPRRYGESPSATENDARKRELGFLKIRYKLPNASKSLLLEAPIPVATPTVAPDVRREVAFSTAVAGFGQLLRGGHFTGKLTFDDVLFQARAAEGPDTFGYRAEFADLVQRAKLARGM
jgi:Ca-activated chloride channel family protein